MKGSDASRGGGLRLVDARGRVNMVRNLQKHGFTLSSVVAVGIVDKE